MSKDDIRVFSGCFFLEYTMNSNFIHTVSSSHVGSLFWRLSFRECKPFQTGLWIPDVTVTCHPVSLFSGTATLPKGSLFLLCLRLVIGLLSKGLWSLGSETKIPSWLWPCSREDITSISLSGETQKKICKYVKSWVQISICNSVLAFRISLLWFYNYFSLTLEVFFANKFAINIITHLIYLNDLKFSK